jgi:histidinol phosphatase-like enzyme (inositol monophosphatase family)
MDKLQEILDFAVAAARQAGDITTHYFQTALQIDTKADDSPVTVADRESEQLLRRLIMEKYPDHGILGEEFGEVNPNSSYRWILDPIDGTFSFIHGVPLYGVMVGLELEGEAVLGVINMPAAREIVYAAKGLGCYFNGKPTHVSAVKELNQALLVAGNTPDQPEGPFWRVRQQVKAFRGWGDCYAHMLVATGRAEIMLDPELAIWDCGALLPILQEAGGTFTSYSGEYTIHGKSGISTNGWLFEQVMELVKG